MWWSTSLALICWQRARHGSCVPPWTLPRCDVSGRCRFSWMPASGAKPTTWTSAWRRPDCRGHDFERCLVVQVPWSLRVKDSCRGSQ